MASVDMTICAMVSNLFSIGIYYKLQTSENGRKLSRLRLPDFREIQNVGELIYQLLKIRCRYNIKATHKL